MKRLGKYMVFFFIVCASLVQAQVQKVYRGRVLIKQDSFVVKQGKLYLDMNMEVSGLGVGRYEMLSLTPVLRSGNKAVALQPVVLNGTNRQKMYRRAIALKGETIAKGDAYLVLKNEPDLIKTFTYNQVISYRKWMKEAELVLIGELYDYSDIPAQRFEDVLTEKIVIEEK